MTKKLTSINVDDAVLKKAKEQFINISQAAELGIKHKLGEITIKPNESVRCEFCGRVHLDEFDNPLKETAKTAKHPDHFSPWRLTWLWPDEMWICNRCLHKKSVKSSICR